MNNEIKRVYRDRFLTSAESAVDAEVRTKVLEEFPLKEVEHPLSPSPFSQILKESIRVSEMSIEEVAGDADVSPTLIRRLLAGEREIHMATADKVAASLGIAMTAK